MVIIEYYELINWVDQIEAKAIDILHLICLTNNSFLFSEIINVFEFIIIHFFLQIRAHSKSPQLTRYVLIELYDLIKYNKIAKFLFI